MKFMGARSTKYLQLIYFKAGVYQGDMPLCDSDHMRLCAYMRHHGLWEAHESLHVTSLTSGDAYMSQWSGSLLVRQWLDTRTARSLYFNQCWLIVNWNLAYKLVWNFNYKMATISQTIVTNTFSWTNSFVFRFEFHWIEFLRVKSTIFQHWLIIGDKPLSEPMLTRFTDAYTRH